MPAKNWRRMADRMAIELAPMAECDAHPLSRADWRNCPDCAIRRVYLDYVAMGGTDTRLETLFGDAHGTPLHLIKPSDRFVLPGMEDGNA
jgi:hypothetical protein